MKKWISVFLVFCLGILMFNLTGCNNNEEVTDFTIEYTSEENLIYIERNQTYVDLTWKDLTYNIYYKVNGTDTVELSKFTPLFDYAEDGNYENNVEIMEELLIPNSVSYNNKTYTVNEISPYAFNGSMAVKVIIPSSIKEIKQNAFCKSSLTETIQFDGTVDIIYGGAFQNYSGLKGTIIIDAKIIQTYAFVYCSFSDVVFSDCTEIIDISPFYFCSEIESAFISKSVRKIYRHEDYGQSVLGHSTIDCCAYPLFYGFEILENIPDSLYKINKLEVDSENPIYDSRDNCNCIIETATNKVICWIDNSVFPEGVIK